MADNSTSTHGTRIFGTTTTECTGFVIQKEIKRHTRFINTHRQAERFILVSHQDQFKKDGKTELDISNTDILMPLYKNMDGKISRTKYFSLI